MLFYPSLMFAGKAKGHPSGAPEWALALFANFRLGWKSLPRTNTVIIILYLLEKYNKTLAYLAHS